MRFALSEEQQELRAAVRKLLERDSTSDQVRQAIRSPEGYDPALWRRMAQELGLHAIALPETYGGSGAGMVELAVVLEELGRALTPGPFLSTVVLAARALLESGDDEACARWLPAIADGRLIATLALVGTAADWNLATIPTIARKTAHGWVLDGTTTFVTDGHAAGLVLVLAGAEEGPGLFAVDAAAAPPGFALERLDTLDPTRAMSTLTVAGTPARPVGRPGSGLATVRRALDVAAIALACEQAGGAGRCLEAAVEYAKTRVQFDRPIGSFQAIKHLLADVLLEIESASAAAYYAAWAVDHDPDRVPALAALCQSFCSDAFVAAAAANVQVHGGIGFTWDHDAHLYLKRANTSKELLGAPTLHRERLAARLFGERSGPPA